MPLYFYIEESPEFQKTLRDPRSDEYKLAKSVIANHTIRESLDILGLVEDAPAFARYELGWVFGLMDATPGLIDGLTVMLRSAMDNDMPIIFKWDERISSCECRVSVVGGKCFITLSTPRLTEEKLKGLKAAYGSALSLV